MKKKVRNIVIIIVAVILAIVIWKLNVYDAQFYSVFFGTAKVHTPIELEEVSYVSFLSPEVEGVYTLNEKEELAMWDDFMDWLNNTTFIKKRSTWGRSYTGEGIFFKFEGVEERLWITIGEHGKSIEFGDYVWKPMSDIVLPVDEEYLLEKKAEQEKEE